MLDKMTELKNLMGQQNEMQEQLSVLNKQIQNLCDELAPQYAKHQIGDRVKQRGVEYQITRLVGGLFNRFPETITKIYVDYYARKILKDGISLHKTEHQLFFWD